jgi:hypothetical protein
MTQAQLAPRETAPRAGIGMMSHTESDVASEGRNVGMPGALGRQSTASLQFVLALRPDQITDRASFGSRGQ